MEIITKKDGNGRNQYFLPDGTKIGFYPESLIDTFHAHLNYVQRLVQMSISGDEDSTLEHIFNVLLDGMEREVEGAFDYIGDNHGIVYVDRAMWHQEIEPETMLGISFEPANKKASGTPDQDTPEA